MGDAAKLSTANGHATAGPDVIPNGLSNGHDERATNGVTRADDNTNGTANGTEPDDDETADSPGQQTSLLSLPPELLDVVLAHVPPAQKLSTVRALSLVLPYSVSRRWRWEHLVLTSPRQFYPLYNALARERERRVKEEESGGRSAGRGGDELVRTLCVECWKGDVDMLNK